MIEAGRSLTCILDPNKSSLFRLNKRVICCERGDVRKITEFGNRAGGRVIVISLSYTPSYRGTEINEP